MAEVVEPASFALQSSITLYETIKTFNSHPKRVRDLLEELEALIAVLGSLSDVVKTPAGSSLYVLNRVPLKRCGDACKDFKQQIMICLSQSGGSRSSFRDWARIRYMNDDIDGFRRLVAACKLTIEVTLGDVKLRKSFTTAENLEKHQILIQTAKCDLEAHLESIDERLEHIIGQTIVEPGSNTPKLRLVKEKRSGTLRGKGFVL
ncbi:hypothetical protein BGW36DRAFT_93845 [Talaromyces proteolyticus]|uniref:Azaphilone pigments biosynthesis cluster protein L N-terminal domain-containing protein n=1 Tax=Talaromyces proteolyticus TaxID=1131652 RepID=A0AAD4L480_9EURO|nr:uncharacterized protein BGW36DRAFT_93845 [Talaromyces proteolyticus]KAH8703918.1 hypothetical protein BGW36DRAFT_93845 [Talaromyces proteolyticus]